MVSVAHGMKKPGELLSQQRHNIRLENWTSTCSRESRCLQCLVLILRRLALSLRYFVFRLRRQVLNLRPLILGLRYLIFFHLPCFIFRLHILLHLACGVIISTYDI